MRRNGLREGMIIRVKDRRLAVFCGRCLCLEDERCKQERCKWGRIAFLELTCHKMCTFGMRIFSTGYSLRKEQAFSILSFGDPLFLKPNGLRAPRKVDSVEARKLSPGRILIRENGDYPFFVVLLSSSGQDATDDFSFQLWEIGRRETEERPFSGESFLDTRLELPQSQLQELVKGLGNRF